MSPGTLESVSGHLRTHSHDALGRPRDASTAYGGATHYERTTYDQHGRVFQSFDASRESASYADGGVRHVHNSRGHLWKVQDAVLSGSTPRTVYWEAKEADALGRVVKEAFGNGAVRTLGHHGKTGRLRALTATRPSQASGDLQDLRFEWDAAGSLTKREDLTGSRDLEETFTYDGLRRMETSRVGSAASDAKSFSYDGYGNLRSKAGVGSYAYFASHPSRLRTAGSDSFTYDADGGMLTGSGRTMTYDAGGRMRSAARGDHAVRFVHGPDGGRIKRTDADSSSGTERTETTLYLGGVEKVTHADGTRTIRRRIGGMALEVRRLSSSGTETSRTTHYLLRDHLGSVSVIADSDATDDAGSAEGERSHGPWGLRRDAATWADLTDAQLGALPEGATRRGYTGHEMLDPVGLVHMNGRVYDPRLGRFLQADPVVGDPSDMLSLNRYAYAHGNPLSNVDPTGHFIEGISLRAIVEFVLIVKAWIDAWTVGGGGLGPEAFRDGLPSGASDWAFGGGGLGFPREGLGGWTRRGAGWSARGGLPSSLQGGRFGHSPVASSLQDCMPGSAGDVLGRPVAPPRPGWVTFRSALGGTFSSESGGKFANAAATAAFKGQMRGGSARKKRRTARSEARQAMYERGPGLYVTGHRVAKTAIHLAIELREEGEIPATLSAGPDVLVLVGERNRDGDFEPGSNFTIGEIDPPGELTPKAYFDQLIEAQKNYCDCLDYDLLPSDDRHGYNSNSYVRGILEATGGSTSVEFGGYVGGAKPVPAEWFRPAAAPAEGTD